MPLKDTIKEDSWWIGFNMTKLGSKLIESLEEALKWTKGEVALNVTEAELTPDGEVLRKTANRKRAEMTPDGKIELDYGKEDLNKEPEGPGTLIDRREPGHARVERDVASVSKEDGVLVDHKEPGHERVERDVASVSKEDGTLIDEWEEGHSTLQHQVDAVSKEEDVTDPEDEYTEDGKKKKKKKARASNVNAIPDEHDKFEPAQKADTKDCDGAIDMNKSAAERWAEIKKALDSSKAILDLEEAQEDEEEDEEMETPPEGGVEEEDIDAEQAAHEEVEDALGEDAAEEYSDNVEGGPVEDANVEGIEPEDKKRYIDSDDDDDGVHEGFDTDEDNDGVPDEEDTDDDGDMVPDVGEDGDGDGIEDNEDTAEEDESQAEQAIIQALADEGYSESEIRHILHGHAPPQVDPLDQAKIDATNAKSEYDQAVSQHDLENKKALSELDVEHKKRVNDAEYEGIQSKHSIPKLEAEHKKRMLELEYEEAAQAKGAQKLDVEHKKRMLDLEYEAAKKEKEMELEMKRKELEMKQKMKEEDAKKRQKERDMQRDAKQTSSAEKKGKNSSLKKSDDLLDDDDIEKADKPGWSKSKTGQLYHPEHGYVNVLHDGNKFSIRHAHPDGGSRTISTHGTKEEAKSALLGFMKNPKGITKIPGGTIGGM